MYGTPGNCHGAKGGDWCMGMTPGVGIPPGVQGAAGGHAKGGGAGCPVMASWCRSAAFSDANPARRPASRYKALSAHCLLPNQHLPSYRAGTILGVQRHAGKGVKCCGQADPPSWCHSKVFPDASPPPRTSRRSIDFSISPACSLCRSGGRHARDISGLIEPRDY